MRRACIAIVFAELLTGCDAKSVRVETDPGLTTYSRDALTGVCFATLGRMSVDTGMKVSESFSITAVPCSPEVLALVPRAQGGSA